MAYNKEKQMTYNKKWVAKNKWRLRAYQLKWHAAHPEYALKKRRWRILHQPIERINQCKRYVNNPSKALAYTKNWFTANPEKKAEYRTRRRAHKLNILCNNLTAIEWRFIKAFFNHKCFYCDAIAPLEMEHMVPLSRGGLHTAENIVPSCKSCNCHKGTKTADEFLLVIPSAHFKEENR